MRVVPVPVRSDNYSYLLIDEKSNKAAAVDVFDLKAVETAAQKEGVQLVAALATHHHHDHTGGKEAYASAYPGTPIYGGSQKVPALTQLVKDKDEFSIGETIRVKCLATPCHTQDSICYHATSTDGSHPGGVFTGDTLFIAGCGRFFEGTPAEMHSSLSYLGTLPETTLVYCGHEYTKDNVAFALSVDPQNDALQKLAQTCREKTVTTGLSTIGDEKTWNPFMRLQTEPIKQATGATSDTDIIRILRDKKNSFKGRL